MKNKSVQEGSQARRQATVWASGWMKGRGATENEGSRFLSRHSVPVDDGWAAEDSDETAGSKVGTELYPDRTVTLIARNASPDIPFEQSINPYKGCEHGCVYCFARPTHAYLDLSPGLDFETKIFYKTNVRDRLVDELGKPGYRCRTIAMGTNTDPYQPAERHRRITRTILETLLEARHPVSIVTKSQLILRDLDLLQELAGHQLATVAVSVTTLSNELKTRLEPRTAGPAARLRVIDELSRAGIPVGAMVAPVIPFVNDHEIEDIVAAATGAGARTMNYILLRLPLEVSGLFEAWLRVHCPDRAERVMNAMRSARGGKIYDAAWGKRMRGEGEMAELIGARFKVALKRNGILGAAQPPLRTDLFRPPQGSQLSLI
ncbi:MAG: PA0069 family radical SAM protein [Pseudomonadales bacterium]|nr:PA0069 family radical SAM protein [Pseudomonadales bacterium]NIX09489.1 PA0069 family radical SAM protein [Pseudomonadales bacterium]